MFKLGQRRGDGAETVLLCMVDYKKPTEAADDKKKSRRKPRLSPLSKLRRSNSENFKNTAPDRVHPAGGILGRSLSSVGNRN